MSMKNPLAPAGIEPATFLFSAQRLNHCATTRPARSESLYRLSYRGSKKEDRKKSNTFLFPNPWTWNSQTDKCQKTLSCDVNRDSARRPGDVTELCVRPGLQKNFDVVFDDVLLGISPASNCSLPKRIHTIFKTRRKSEIKKIFDVLLTVHLSIFIFVINQLDVQNSFYNKTKINTFVFSQTQQYFMFNLFATILAINQHNAQILVLQ